MSTISNYDPTFFLLKGPALPPASLAPKLLGRLVKNFAQPTGDAYFPEDATPFIMRPLLVTPLHDAQRVTEAIHKTGFKTKLSNLAGLEAVKMHQGGTADNIPNVVSIELQHAPDVFRRMNENPTIREEICKMITPGGKPMYLAVGVLLFESAQRVDWSAKCQTVTGSLNAPVGAAASAALAGTTGFLLDPSAIEDISQEYGRLTGEGSRHSAVYGDSRIFAIQYKIVRRRRRSYLQGSVPVLEASGPRFPAERTYGEQPHLPQPSKNDNPLELESDGGTWIDSIEDDDAGDIQTSKINICGKSFVLASDEIMEGDTELGAQ